MVLAESSLSKREVNSSNDMTFRRARKMVQNVSVVIVNHRSPSWAPGKEYLYNKIRNYDTKIVIRYTLYCRHIYPNVQTTSQLPVYVNHGRSDLDLFGRAWPVRFQFFDTISTNVCKTFFPDR
jgi:hypothetical protein